MYVCERQTSPNVCGNARLEPDLRSREPGWGPDEMTFTSPLDGEGVTREATIKMCLLFLLQRAP